MAIYINSAYSKANSYLQPDHEIPKKGKNAEWICNMAKFIYGQYCSGQTGITPEDAKRIRLFWQYMDGNQPHEIYRQKYLSESTTERKKEYGHIDWNNVYSPMPKIVDKVLGMFISQDHNTIATCTNEFSKQYKIKKKAEQYAMLKLQGTRNLLNQLIGINPDEDPLLNPLHSFLLRDVEEIDIVANNSYKLNHEIASEKIIEQTKAISNFRYLKRTAVRDLLCGYIAMRDNIDNKGHIIKWENVDITDVIIQYSRNNHFNNSGYFGIQELWSIEDLRKKGFSEEDCKKVASSYFSYNMESRGLQQENRAFQFYDTYYSATKKYGYDDFVVPVLYVAFKSNDINYLNNVKIKNGEERVYPADFGKIKPNTIIDIMERIYEGRWIVGTDVVFDNGVLAATPRDASGNVRLPIHIAKLDGKSIIERVKHTLDEFAMLGYKLQHALARSNGKQAAFDFSALDEISMTTAGKIEPSDIINMYYQGAGVPYRSIPIDSTINYSRPKPVEELEGGIGNYLNELLILREAYYRELADLTGVSTIEAPNNNLAVGVAQLAVANMADVLKPLYDIYLEVKENIAYNTVYRVQTLLIHDKVAYDYYVNNVGLHYIEYLKMAAETEPLDIGIKFEALPNDELKQSVIMWADRATQGGKNGVPILKGSEFLYIIESINTPSGLHQARMILAKRERDDEIASNQRQMAAIQAQGQQIQEQVALKGAIDGNKIDKQLQADLTILSAEKELEDKQKGVDMAYGAINKGIDTGMTAYDNPNQKQ